MSIDADNCNICIHNQADDYDVPTTMCDICENNEAFEKRTKGNHPCLNCRFLKACKHACPCDILKAYVDEHHVSK